MDRLLSAHRSLRLLHNPPQTPARRVGRWLRSPPAGSRPRPKVCALLLVSPTLAEHGLEYRQTRGADKVGRAGNCAVAYLWTEESCFVGQTLSDGFEARFG